jgi:toxin FitB
VSALLGAENPIWLLDTNVVSELMRPQPDAGVLAWLAAQPVQQLRLSAVSVTELWLGAFLLPKGDRRSQLLAGLSLLMAQFRDAVVPLDEAAAIACAGLLADRRRQGRPMGWPDAQIAGIASCHALTLVTRNTRDFDGCGIPLLNPWAPT